MIGFRLVYGNLQWSVHSVECFYLSTYGISALLSSLYAEKCQRRLKHSVPVTYNEELEKSLGTDNMTKTKL